MSKQLYVAGSALVLIGFLIGIIGQDIAGLICSSFGCLMYAYGAEGVLRYFMLGWGLLGLAFLLHILALF